MNLSVSIQTKSVNEALPGALFSGAILGNREHRKSRFCFLGNKEKRPFFSRGTREQVPRPPPPPREGLVNSVTIKLSVSIQINSLSKLAFLY